MTDRHILAIGGILPERNSAALVDYCLQLTGKARPNLGFIGTASGDAALYTGRFQSLVSQLDCEVATLPLFARTPDVDDWVASQDVILVGGGNTKSMLAVWREWGLPELLRETWKQGTILAGWSAGAICWFEQGVTDSYADRLDSLDCLGFLSGSCCPHYSGEVDRRPAYERLVAEDRITPGIAVDDGAGVHFVNGERQAIVTVSSSAGAYHVAKSENGEVKQSSLDVERIEIG